VETVLGLLITALVAALVVMAMRKTRHEQLVLNDILHNLEGQWVSVTIGGTERTFITLNGVVRGVEADCLRLDSPSALNLDPLQAVLLGPVRLDEGVPLHRIRSVRGPRGTIHWP
jgi:hypothetical protein